jgi:Fe-S oxidoreductase
VLSNFQVRKNAWRLPAPKRVEWEKDCDISIPDFRKEQNEYLLFVGDTALITETQHIPKHVAKLLQKGGVNFGTLKEQEVDSGNDVRAMGERGLFEELAEQNIETFKQYGVKKIITISPHDYQAISHDYPKLGMQFEGVYHYTQIIADLLKEGKIKFENKVSKTVTFQDPCHLGRYNDAYEAPREIIKAIPGLNFVEMSLNKEFAMCCGAGGGRMWHDPEEGKQRIADARIKHAKDVGAEIVATACPYCLNNFNGADIGDIQVKDVAELVLETMVE